MPKEISDYDLLRMAEHAHGNCAPLCPQCVQHPIQIVVTGVLLAGLLALALGMKLFGVW